ncbi:hypothetical protein [Thermococcus barophilus]|uniref:Uncharacterized protein n=1 Tax=Thermococcus barophilus TaxID=55802 RepID=A0A0S1XAR1_THEBA|nr:hypothetical protein [Thermococcus barophilus]ALM74847.1 hypothetical protein TBCH5v1_0895 [Thermococcus barophilus]
MFNPFKRKKKRDGGLPKRVYYVGEDKGLKESIIEEKLGPKAEERTKVLAIEETPLEEYKPEKETYEEVLKQLDFKKTHHTVVKILFKRPETRRREIITLGYVQGVALAPNGLIAIAYLPRAPSWLDEFFMTITRTVARYKHLKVLWGFEPFVHMPVLDHTIIVEASEIRESIYGKLAVPPFSTEEEKALFEATYAKATTLEELVRTLLEEEMKELLTVALHLNPYVSGYKLIENIKDKKKRTERIKEAEGGEVKLMVEKSKSIWEDFDI